MSIEKDGEKNETEMENDERELLWDMRDKDGRERGEKTTERMMRKRELSIWEFYIN